MSDEGDEPGDSTEVNGDGADEPGHRVKGEHQPGSIPLKELGRILIIGIPVMIAAWYFLLWMKGGF